MHALLFLTFCTYISIVQPLNTKLTLPWGTWEAHPLPKSSNIYLFQNVRFGGTPIRFGNSSYPSPITDNSTLQNSSYGPSCIQIDPKSLENPPGGRIDVGAGIMLPPPGLVQSEDCLFLDIYVPASALRTKARKLPVILWLFGGAYAYGSKLFYGPEWPFYTGQGILESSAQKAIFIAGNYRLGAFGWLAGSYMEKNGLPNAGLYDQRLMLEFIHDFIGKIGGDNSDVTVWGQSAGAGSILHHVTQFNGKRDPLFSKAFLQSPGFEWQWDRSGTMDNYYKNFSQGAGCAYTFNISCLRSANISTLARANQQLFADVHQTGLFPLGPSVDGTWISQLPAVQFANGAYWKGLKSVMISHVANESGSFIPKHVVNQLSFEEFLLEFMPEEKLDRVRQAIQNQYDCTAPPYNGDFRFCVATMIRDSVFTCSTRQLYDAYKGKAYMMQFSFPGPLGPPALHAMDLIPTFINSGTDVKALLLYLTNSTIEHPELATLTIKALKAKYQKYLASYAAFGNPNKAKHFGTPTWSFATDDGDQVQGVLEARLAKSILHDPFFDTIDDTINTHTSCEFWTKAAQNISKILSKPEDLGGRLFVQNLEL